jgi:hypothetical protein
MGASSLKPATYRATKVEKIFSFKIFRKHSH